MSNPTSQAEALRSALKLARPESIDQSTRTLLSSLHGELGTFLASAAATGEASESAIDHLEQIALRFEAEHPTVGAAVRQAIDTLVKAGI
jgi:Domain of unknown function (DUF4404)